MVVGLLLATALGLAIGSFLNVCIDRLPKGRSLIRPRSHCDACGRTLGLAELIPVAGYLWLRGRCRRCAAPIPVRLPLVEAVTGLAFAAAWLALAATI